MIMSKFRWWRPRAWFLSLGLAWLSGAVASPSFCETLQLPLPMPQGISSSTLGSPGSVSNVFSLRREISPDGSQLWQERYWLRGEDVRLIQDERTNAAGVVTLNRVPPAAWSGGHLLSDFVKTKDGACVRFRPLSELPSLRQQLEQVRARLLSEHPNAIVTPGIEPDQWHSTNDSDLRFYELSVDPALVQRLGVEGTTIESNRITMPVNNRFTGGTATWECDFDPQTHAKIAERVWAGTNLIREQIWEPNTNSNASQFVLPCKPSAEPPPTGYIGAGLSRDKSFDRIVKASPADQAGIRVGDHLLAVNGKSAGDLSFEDLAGMIRGEPDTEVALDIQTSSGEKKHLRLRRAALSSTTH
jgi:hypothetical protein